MNRNKINYRFVNIIFILVIIYLLYMTFGLWSGIVQTIVKVILPFFLAFAIAYVLYPFVLKLQNKNIPKGLAIFIVFAILIAVIVLLIWLVIPIMIEQLTALVTWITSFIKSLSEKHNVDLDVIQGYIGDLNTIIASFSKSIGDFSINIINKSINVISLLVIAFISAIYFLSGMEKFRLRLKKYLKNKNRRVYNYIKRLDYEVSKYFVGLEKFMIIQFIEYTFIFFIIGHPYYLLLGFLCSVTTIIPYFGGIFCNILACVTAFFISKTLFILSLLVAFVVPNIDGYIISPRIYGKTNNVPALLTIFAAYAGGKMFGFIGILIALPLVIILLSTYRFYEDEINQKIENIKNKI